MDHRQTVDEELVQMISEGDTAALEVVYDRYSRSIYSLTYRILRDTQSAEEAMQDTFVSLWKRADTYNRDQGRVYSWLLGIARNRAVDEIRRRYAAGRIPPHLLMSDEPFEIPSDGDDGAEAVWISEVRELVHEAVSELPREQRQVIEMSYLKGLSQREISEITDIPLGTVKTRMRLAMRKLKEILEPLSGKAVDLDGM